MDQQKAESIVLLSAAVVGGGYLYRRVSEGETTEPKRTGALSVLGQGEILPTGKFVTGFGVTYIVLSALASLAPELGASFAGLVAAGSFFFNASAISRDVKTGLGRRSLSSLPKATGLGSTLGTLEGIEPPAIPHPEAFRSRLNRPPTEPALAGLRGGVQAH